MGSMGPPRVVARDAEDVGLEYGKQGHEGGGVADGGGRTPVRKFQQGLKWNLDAMPAPHGLI